MAPTPSSSTPSQPQRAPTSAANNARPQRKQVRRPTTTSQKPEQAKQGLKIIPFNPDPSKRKAARRNVLAAAQKAEPGASTAEDAEKEAKEFNEKQTELLKKVERIPSTRSWDPFNALAVLYISKEERFILNYAYTRSWKVWEDPLSGTNKFAQAWMWRSMESSAAFYAQLVGAASHYQICRRETPISSDKLATVRLQAKSKAIERLRSEITQFHRKTSSIPFDSLLMAVFCLAVHDNIDVRGEEEPHPFSALAKLRDMQIYGRVVFGGEHMNAMYQLIEQKGGLSCIDEHAFGTVVPLLDVIYSIRSQTKPRFPCKKTLKSIRHPSIWEPDEEGHRLLEVLGSAFRIDEDLPFKLNEDLRTVMQVVAEMTAGLDHFQRSGAKPFKNLLALLDNTDWAGHRLASMSSFEEDEGQEFHEVVWNEICRLTTLLYIDLVAFPTPPQAGVKDTLSRLLLNQLSILAEYEYWTELEESRTLVQWAAMIGGIAAWGLELQDAYTDFIADSFAYEDAMSWDELRQRMSRYLWVDIVCDKPAKGLWEAACIDGQLGDADAVPNSTEGGA